MKNSSNNDYSKKNSNKNKIRSRSRNSYKSHNLQEDKVDFDKNETFESNNLKKRNDFKFNEYRSLRSKAKSKKNNSNNSQRKFPIDKPYIDKHSVKKPRESIQKLNDRNFDDWIWGKHSVFEALNSKRPINRLWCTPEIYSSEKFFLLLKDLKSKGVLIEEVSWSRLSQLTYGAVHQGVALQLSSSKTISLENLIDISKTKSSNPIIVALDGVTDPHNLGAIIRSAEAFDCKGIIIPQRRSAGLTGTVAKVAAGALEHISVSRVVNLNRAIDELKKNGFLIIGLSGDGKVPISKFNEKVPLVLIVGAEDKGISLLTQKNCDYLIKIPLKGKTSSLNASVAAAISICHISNN